MTLNLTVNSEREFLGKCEDDWKVLAVCRLRPQNIANKTIKKCDCVVVLTERSRGMNLGSWFFEK